VQTESDAHDPDHAQIRIEAERRILGRHFDALEVPLMPIPIEVRLKLMKGFPASKKAGFLTGPYYISRTRTMLQYLNQVYWMDLETHKLLASGDLYQLDVKKARNVVLALTRIRTRYVYPIWNGGLLSPKEKRDLSRWNYLNRVVHSDESWARAKLRYQYPSSMRTQTS